jgi:hypothetical protein
MPNIHDPKLSEGSRRRSLRSLRSLPHCQGYPRRHFKSRVGMYDCKTSCYLFSVSRDLNTLVKLLELLSSRMDVLSSNKRTEGPHPHQPGTQSESLATPLGAVSKTSVSFHSTRNPPTSTVSGAPPGPAIRQAETCHCHTPRFLKILVIPA